jgi:hypothetical protein
VSALTRFASLPAAERRLLAKAALLQLAVVGGMRLVRFERLQRSLAWLSRARPRPLGSGALPLERVVWAVDATAPAIPGSTCLSRALTAQVLLRRRGHPARLRIGVSKDSAQRLEAHAWLESGDRLVLGARGHERYSPLPPLDGRSEGQADPGKGITPPSRTL